MTRNAKKARLDWRYRTVTTLASQWTSPHTGVTYPPGTPVSKSTFVRHNDRELKIGDPSGPALFLDLSHKAFTEALRIHPFLVAAPSPKNVDPSRSTYDYLENIISSVLFSFTALEAWANEEIPEDYRHEQQRRTGIFVLLAKPSIERRVDLNEKLATILPQVKNVPSPKGTKVWQQYVTLKNMRDRIVHLKSADRRTSNDRDLFPDSIWSKLLDPTQDNYPLYAKQMILHFIPSDRYHWLKYCPIK